MPMTPDALEADLRAAFPDASIEIQDLAGDGDHYKARIVSQAFAAHLALQRGIDKLVLAHALALETAAP